MKTKVWKAWKGFTGGQKVTIELSRYYDGTPVKNWPHSHYVGIVKEIIEVAGQHYAKVGYGKDCRGKNIYRLENLERLTIISVS